jgi:D-arabinose 1-dehydrogenase-like Zn-dependent alcohol dehydrogenase
MPAPQVPDTCTAIVIDSSHALSRASILVPTPGPGQALVRVSHAAQNPTDVQSLDSRAFEPGAVLGCDFVGTVVKLGPPRTDEPDKRRLNVGDVIAGLIWGGEVEGQGAYAQYTVADEDICFKVPEGSKREDAVTVPLAAATAWMALFSPRSLGIKKHALPEAVLIWGGSSSVGLYAIQIAHAHGIKTITTCSPHNFDLVRSHGATHVFAHSSPTVIEDIRALGIPITYIFDTIGSAPSPADEPTTTTSSIASRGATTDPAYLCTVRPGLTHTDALAPGVRARDVFVFTAFLKPHSYAGGKMTWPLLMEDHEVARKGVGKGSWVHLFSWQTVQL